ncbi:MAG TPA: hydroxymethylbilane synthase [Burkholderiaceae bacterium]|nr:hydroxymethylbilane synthase [Burkholderiaceae bacterium]
MSLSSAKLRIATRASPLALWQADHVRKLLLQADPSLQIELLELTTRGDQILDRTLSKVGGKGLFVKELEVALLEGRADLAVHSLKDVPMELAPEFDLAAILERADPRDCLVSSRFARLEQMPEGARVGTSSLRREMALRARFPQLQIVAVRGNVGTRLAKLDRGDFDALVMAVAGLQRLGLAERIAQMLAPEVFLPAPGQGALAIEIRAGDGAVQERVRALEHAPTRAAVAAERAVSRGLGGSCEFPLAAYAQITQEQLHLRAWAGNAARGEMMEAQGSGPMVQAEAIGLRVVNELKARGVERLLRGG